MIKMWQNLRSLRLLNPRICASDLAFYDTQTVLCITGDTQIRYRFAPNLRGSRPNLRVSQMNTPVGGNEFLAQYRISFGDL